MLGRDCEALTDFQEAAEGEHRESQHDLALTPSCSRGPQLSEKYQLVKKSLDSLCRGHRSSHTPVVSAELYLSQQG